MQILFVLLTAADPIEAAAAHLRTAQDAIQAAPKACNDALRVQIKAARMQLELSKEAKDAASAQSSIGGLKELAQEATQRCPPPVAASINNAIAALQGQPTDPDDDPDLKADQPKPSDPPTTPATQPATPNSKPFISAGQTPDPAQAVADAAKVLAKGFTATGQTWRGYAKRTDWVQPLEAGKCYAFVGVGGPSTKRMALYLWDPSGRRQAERRAKEPVAVLYHCPYVSGPYHVQAKVKRPESGYAVGVYVR